jgi:hypothetical protein
MVARLPSHKMIKIIFVSGNVYKRCFHTLPDLFRFFISTIPLKNFLNSTIFIGDKIPF